MVYSSATIGWAFGAFFALATAIGLPMAIGGLLANDGLLLTIGAVGWIAVLVSIWFVMLVRSSFVVRRWQDGRVVFRSALRERETTTTQIRAVRRGRSRRTLLFDFHGGPAQVPATPPMLDLVKDVRRCNPSATVSGI